MTFSPTPEQEAIVAFARDDSRNLVIEALAGAAKTTTLTLISAALSTTPILAIAFNKRIAEEMKRRLTPNAVSKTLNSVGHSAWAQQLGRTRLVVDPDKTYNNFRAIINELRDRRQFTEAGVLSEQQADILRAVRQAKSQGWVPDGYFPGSKTLVDDHDFYASVEHEFDEDVDLGIVKQLVIEGIKQAYQGLIDFDDQIYMPTLFGGRWPSFPLVMIDEAQDLSNINHAMLERLVVKRLIAVGDPYQAIYGFRGATADSMNLLAQRYSMERLGLSVSFRCPIAVIKRAHFRAPHMKWAEWAAEGEVNVLSTWSAASIPDGAAIICRLNAPLLHMALELLKAGRGVEMVGMDLGPQLVRALKKLGAPEMPQSEVLEKIEAWKQERLKKGKRAASITDRAECLKVFAEFGETLAAAIAYAEHIFASKGPIQLLSGHKSKGLEWDVVYHLDPHLIPSRFATSDEDKTQEANVRYVIETRPKKVLNLVTTEGFEA